MNTERVAMIFGHPAHELSALGMLQRFRPESFYLTQANSCGEDDREETSRKTLERFDLARNATFFGLSELESYERMLRGDLGWYDRSLEAICDWLREVRPTAAFCDAFEFYNIHHDICSAMTMAACRRVGLETDLFHLPLACNANRPVPDWFSGGEWKPRPSVQTLANAMDVGDPSNMERLFHLYPEGRSIRDHASAMSVDDETIRRVISAGPQRWGHVWCSHTATAVHVREQQQSDNWVIVATAHPAKFDIVVEPLVGHAVEVPEALRQLLARPTRVTEIDAELEQLRDGMGQPS